MAAKYRSTFSRYSDLKKSLQIEEIKTELVMFYEMLQEDPALGDEINSEIGVLNSKLKALEEEKQNPDDKKNANIEIQAGVGGDESALFAADLYKIYELYANSKNLTLEVLDITPGNAGGFKNIVFTISGNSAYGYFKTESGAHRVQRVPATETKGRVHTSIASAIVLPERNIEHIDVNKADVKVETYNSGGKGGQHSNRSMNAVKLTHLPTNISVCSQMKSQTQNMKLAWKALATKISDYVEQSAESATADAKRKLRGSGMRNERIRTYNYPQDRVTDHRIKQSYSLTSVVAGDLDKLFADLKEKLEN